MRRICGLCALLPLLLTCSGDDNPTQPGPTVYVEGPDPVVFQQVTVTDSTIQVQWAPSEEQGFEWYALSVVQDTARDVVVFACTLSNRSDTLIALSGMTPGTTYRITVEVGDSDNLTATSVLVATTGTVPVIGPAVVRIDSACVAGTLYRGVSSVLRFAEVGDSIAVQLWLSGEARNVHWTSSGGGLYSPGDSLQAVLVVADSGIDTVSCVVTGADSAVAVFQVFILSEGVAPGALLVDVLPEQAYLLASDSASVTVRVVVSRSDSSAAAGVAVTMVSSEAVDTATLLVRQTLGSTTDSLGRATFVVTGGSYDAELRLVATAQDSTGWGTGSAAVWFACTRYLTMTAAPGVVAADGQSTATIEVRVKTDRGNPCTGEQVRFSTTAGIITASRATDEFGVAEALLVSDRRNVTARVAAWLDQDPTRRDSVNVVFTGVTLVPSWVRDTIRPDGLDTAFLTVTLKDACGEPMAGEPLNWAVQQPDTTLIVEADIVTDVHGRADCRVVGTGSGSDTLVVVSAGAILRPILFYQGPFMLTVDTLPGQTYMAGSGDSVGIVVSCRTGAGIGIPGAIVAVSVSDAAGLGGVSTRESTTDGDGSAYLWLRCPAVPGVVQVVAQASSAAGDVTTSYDIRFGGGVLARLSISVTPNSIMVGGDTAHVSATASDSLNNRLEGIPVSFSLVQSVGGGDRLVPITATTGPDGLARCSYVSGALPSMRNEVQIRAQSPGGVVSDTACLTVGGPPAHIAISMGGWGLDNRDGTLSALIAAVVSDINGNPVVDSTPVSFACDVTGLVSWRYTVDWWGDADYYGWLFADIDTAYPIVIPFEDMNDNYASFELEEDRNFDGVVSRGEDLNGDGIYVPGPGFEDINHNGVRDSGQQEVEPWKRYQRQDDSAYFDPSDSTIKYITRIIWDTAWADFNGNNKIDIREPLLNKHLDSTMSWDQYVAQRDAAQGGFGYDLVLEDNGVADPQTAVAVNRSVLTADGAAHNRLTYPASDAGRVQVTVTAECGGVVSTVPLVIILPEIQ